MRLNIIKFKSFFNKEKNMGIFSKGYIDWSEYKAKIDFTNDFFWQQAIRKSNARCV